MDLGHVGLHVRDFDGMLAFYQRVFGFVISDIKRAEGRSIVFFTSRPDTHHQFVLANGRGQRRLLRSYNACEGSHA